MRRHWSQLQRLQSQGPQRQREMTYWKPNELKICKKPNMDKTRRQEKELKKSNELMASRLYAILDPDKVVVSGSKNIKDSKRTQQREKAREDEAAYLQRRSYRARVLQDVRSSREKKIEKQNEVMQHHINTVESRVPHRDSLEKEYTSRRNKYGQLRRFQVPSTAFHLISKSPQSKRRPKSASRVTASSSSPKLPQWFGRHGDANASPVDVFATSAPPDVTMFEPTYTRGNRKGDKKPSKRLSRPQSAAVLPRHANQEEDDDSEGDAQAIDLLIYSGQELREKLFGTTEPSKNEKTKAEQRSEDDSPSKHDAPLVSSPIRNMHKPPAKESFGVDASLLDEDSKLDLRRLICSHHANCQDLLTEQDGHCRTRCCLLSELPPQRVNRPRHSLGTSQLDALSFNIALYDVGLVCPMSRLKARRAGDESPKTSPSKALAVFNDPDALVPLSTGILIKCCHTRSGDVAESLYIPIQELQYACETTRHETASTISLCRKLIRLPCKSRSRLLYDSLSGSLSAEGHDQLCSFLSQNLQIQITPEFCDNCREKGGKKDLCNHKSYRVSAAI